MKIKKTLYKIALVDIFFLIFLKPLPITLTTIPVLISSVVNFNLKNNDDRLIFSFIIPAICSLLYSIVSNESIDLILNNVIFFTLVLIFFSYFIEFKKGVEKYFLFTLKALEVNFFLLFFLAFIFLLNPSTYFYIRSFFTFGGVVIQVGELSSVVRYTAFFSDPNNCSVVAVSLYSILMIYKKNSTKMVVLYTGILILVVASTMSSTGVISVVIVAPFILYNHVFKGGGSKLWSTFGVFGVLVAIYVIYLIVLDTDLGRIALQRISENSAESRFEKFKILSLDEVAKRLMVGDGGTIVVNGAVFKPHIGHLHMFLNYGLIAYISFMLLVFRVRNGKILLYVPILPIFLGFTANTGFIDFRFAVFSAIVLSMYAVTAKKIEG